MRTIEISEAVWQAIAEQGKFSETEDDVLRRVFKIPPQTEDSSGKISSSGRGTTNRTPSRPRRSFATQRMSSYIKNNLLYISFAGGASNSWSLPEKTDKSAIRTIRDKAVTFAKDNGATIGQQNAVKKALTDNGYHLSK